MRIIIFSDSLGRPRPDLSETEQTRIGDVYGEMLRKKLQGIHDIDLVYIESLDSEDAIFWGERMVAYREPDVVIFHLGINDCVPRLFKKSSRSIVLNDVFRKVTGDIFLKVMSKFRFYFTKLRPLVHVGLDDFISNINTIEEGISRWSPGCEFYFVGIAGSKAMEVKSYNYNANIARYNKALAEKYREKFIDADSMAGNGDLLISDHVHFNKQMHFELFKVLDEMLRK